MCFSTYIISYANLVLTNNRNIVFFKILVLSLISHYFKYTSKFDSNSIQKNLPLCKDEALLEADAACINLFFQMVMY